jgi:DNA end-binding protein Ku
MSNGDGGMVMEQLRYADEVRRFSEVPVEQGEVARSELKLAKQLVEASSADAFEPEKYHDQVRQQMLEMIQRKVEGEEITAAPAAAAPQPQIIDLMAALKASLSEKEGRKPAARASKKKAAVAKADKKTARRKSARG